MAEDVEAEKRLFSPAGYDPLIEARELSVADKRRLQARLAHSTIDCGNREPVSGRGAVRDHR